MDIDLYIDVIFFVNFFADSLLLWILKRFLKRPASPGRILCGGVAGGIFGCLEVWLWQMPSWVILSVSFVAAALMIKIVFRPENWRELVKETGSFYLLAVLTGGMMEFLYGYTSAGFYVGMVRKGEKAYAMPLLMWLFLILGACFLAAGIRQLGSEIIKERKNRYLIILADGNIVVETTGYLDTGNCLTEPESGGKVQIVAERIWNLFNQTEREKAMIPYHTVGNPYGVMTGIQIERMEICGIEAGSGKSTIKVRNPWIARAPFGLTRDKSYEVLLHGETIMAGQP